MTSARKPNRREQRRQLIAAIREIDFAGVREIAGADPSIVNAANSHHNVPLGDAVETGNAALVKLLLDLGADPRHCNHGGHSQLDGAAFSGRTEIAHLLAAAGAVPGVHHLAALGDLAALDRTVRVDPSLLEPTPAGGRWKMAPLHAAVLGGSVEAVRCLLSLSASVDPLNHNEHTPLALIEECASPESRRPIAELLLAHRADPNAAAGHHGGVLLHRAVMNGDDLLARLLLEHGADPDRQDWSGKTPLHHAVEKNRKLVELILGASPTLDLESRKGETALQLARRLKKPTIVRMFEA